MKELQTIKENLVKYLKEDAAIPLIINDIDALLENSVLGKNKNLGEYPIIEAIMEDTASPEIMNLYEMQNFPAFEEEFRKDKERSEALIDEHLHDSDYFKVEYFLHLLEKYKDSNSNLITAEHLLPLPINLTFYFIQKYPNLLKARLGASAGLDADDLFGSLEKKQDKMRYLVANCYRLRAILEKYVNHIAVGVRQQADDLATEENLANMREMLFASALMLNLGASSKHDPTNLAYLREVVSLLYILYDRALRDPYRDSLSKGLKPQPFDDTYLANAVSILLSASEYFVHRSVMGGANKFLDGAVKEFKFGSIHSFSTSFSLVERMINLINLHLDNKDKPIDPLGFFFTENIQRIMEIFSTIIQGKDIDADGTKALEAAKKFFTNHFNAKPSSYIYTSSHYFRVYQYFEIAAYSFQDNKEELFQLADNAIQVVSAEGSNNYLILAIYKGFTKYATKTNDQKVQEYANNILDTYNHKSAFEKDKKMYPKFLEVKELLELGFTDGVMRDGIYFKDINLELSDEEYAKKGKLKIKKYELETWYRGLSVPIVKDQLGIKGLQVSETGTLTFNKKTVIDTYHYSQVLVTKDKDNKVEGMLFVDNGTIIGGLNHVLFFGRIGKSKESLDEYVKRLQNPENFISMKRYILKQ